MYIRRELENELKILFKEYPVITLTGPRQSGETTTIRNIFPEFKYVSLENPNQRDLSKLDPIKFLGNGEEPMIIDEIQRVPGLVSYIQRVVDDANRPGIFILKPNSFSVFILVLFAHTFIKKHCSNLLQRSFLLCREQK